MLSVEAIDVKYGGVHALSQVSLSVQTGEFVAIVGANGAGKTTLLKTVSGLVRAAAGHVLLEGKALSKLSAEQIVGLGVAQVPEGRHIFPDLTVMENLQLGAFTLDRGKARQNLEKMLARFPRLSERSRQLGHTLSGGEQQMLAIARGVMSSPRLLLLDEPSMGLSPRMVKEIFSVIDELNRDGVSILMVEQNARMALRHAHRGYVLENGRVVLSGDAANLRNDPEVQRRYLGYGDSSPS